MLTLHDAAHEASSRTPEPGRGRALILGCRIDRVDMDQAVARCDELIARNGFGQHMAVNAAKLVAMQDDERLREITRNCELVTADGQSVVWASRILGDPLPVRVAGIDLMERLFAHAEDRGYRVFVLGARREVLERAIERIRQRHPRLELAGYRDGYFADAERDAVAAGIRAARPHILFVAMSSPRKEYFLGELRPGLGVPFAMGVGGAIDVIAGAARRAPRVLQVLGLEWLFRLAQEPRRLLGRYLATNGRFVWLVLREALAARLRRRGR